MTLTIAQKSPPVDLRKAVELIASGKDPAAIRALLDRDQFTTQKGKARPPRSVNKNARQILQIYLEQCAPPEIHNVGQKYSKALSVDGHTFHADGSEVIGGESYGGSSFALLRDKNGAHLRVFAVMAFETQNKQLVAQVFPPGSALPCPKTLLDDAREAERLKHEVLDPMKAARLCWTLRNAAKPLALRYAVSEDTFEHLTEPWKYTFKPLAGVVIPRLLEIVGRAVHSDGSAKRYLERIKPSGGVIAFNERKHQFDMRNAKMSEPELRGKLFGSMTKKIRLVFANNKDGQKLHVELERHPWPVGITASLWLTETRGKPLTKLDFEMTDAPNNIALALELLSEIDSARLTRGGMRRKEMAKDLLYQLLGQHFIGGGNS